MQASRLHYELAFRRTEYRLAGSGGAWLATPATSSIATGIGGRINHFTTINGLNYSTQYEYRVRHTQADVLVNQFSDTFLTRNPVSDASKKILLSPYKLPE